MLKAEIEHIKNNYVELIENTTCDVALLTRLQQEDLLSQSDVEILQIDKKTRTEKSKHLYEILQTRTKAYPKLKEALKQEKQTRAFEILQNVTSKFASHGLISFDMLHQLGKGRSGTVVLKGTFDGREVAVKVIRENCDQALREVNILKNLDQHENIVRYYFAEQVDTTVYIALELCQINLENEIEMKLINPNPTKLLEECTKGVAFLHMKGVIHRDLKPANILLTQNGRVKICDFGFSKSLANGVSMATTSGVYGTCDWMAPEVLAMVNNKTLELSKVLTNKADIFALGCVYYYVLTNGKHPFGLPLDRPYRILRRSSDVEDSTLNDTWKRVISIMIAYLPDQRPTTDHLLRHECFSLPAFHAGRSPSHYESACTYANTRLEAVPIQQVVNLTGSLAIDRECETRFTSRYVKSSLADIAQNGIPHDAVLAGTDRDGNPIYVIVAKINSMNVPGSLIVTPDLAEAYVEFEGPITVEEFAVLTGPKSAFAWIKCNIETVPHNAITTGQEDIFKLHIGRVEVFGGKFAGKIILSHAAALWIAYKDETRFFEQNFECLVQNVFQIHGTL